MKAFERSSDYMTKIFLDALIKEVWYDCECICIRVQNRLRVYHSKSKNFLQFPNKLRSEGRKYLCDVQVIKRKNGGQFMRAYAGSIRDAKTGEVIG